MDQQFSIKCPRHPKRLCEVFTTQESSYCLLCIQCFSEETISALSQISFEDILNGEKDSILKNWPPLGPKAKDIFQGLEEISTSQNPQAQILDVESFFEDAEKSLIEAIRKKKKEILEQIGSIPLKGDQAIKEYQKIAQIQQLRTTLLSKQDSQKIEQDLKAIIQSQKINCQTNSDKLEIIIQENKLPRITLNQVQSTLNQLIQIISSIQLLSQNQREISVDLQVEESSKGRSKISLSELNQTSLQIPTFIKSNNEDNDAYCKMINTLKNHKKYILRLQLINHADFNSSVNFIPQNEDQKNENYQIQFWNYRDQISSKIIKGKDIWNMQYYKSIGQTNTKKVASVELRICIKEKYIVVLDRPSYENAIQLSTRSPDSFVQDSDYLIQFYIFYRNDSITVEELSEVDKFPDI